MQIYIEKIIESQVKVLVRCGEGEYNCIEWKAPKVREGDKERKREKNLDS